MTNKTTNLLACGLIGSVLLATVFGVAETKANRVKDPPCVVIMGYKNSYVTQPNGNLLPNGLVVTWVNSSPGSPPPVPVGANLSDSEAYYMDNSFDRDTDTIFGIVRFRRK